MSAQEHAAAVSAAMTAYEELQQTLAAAREQADQAQALVFSAVGADGGPSSAIEARESATNLASHDSDGLIQAAVTAAAHVYDQLAEYLGGWWEG